MNTLCSCGCSGVGMLPIDDEIGILEEHKKILKDRIGTINKKITSLNPVTEP